MYNNRTVPIPFLSFEILLTGEYGIRIEIKSSRANVFHMFARGMLYTILTRCCAFGIKA